MTITDLAKRRFMEDCKDARLATLPDGNALLFVGDRHPIEVRVSALETDPVLDWLVEALRRVTG